jgi:hypothetical protein
MRIGCHLRWPGRQPFGAPTHHEDSATANVNRQFVRSPVHAMATAVAQEPSESDLRVLCAHLPSGWPRDDSPGLQPAVTRRPALNSTAPLN